VNGVSLGLQLFLQSLLPAIMPFIILSNLIVKMNFSEQIGKLFYPITHFLFNCSYNGSYAIVMGFLCGYPVGAKIICDLISEKKLSPEEGTYIFRFANHTSPAFIQGYIALSLFSMSNYRLPALLLAFIPEIITGIIFRNNIGFVTNSSTESSIEYPFSKILDDSIFNGLITVAKTGGYLILFSVIACLISEATFLPSIIKIMLISITEITSGTYYISLLNINKSLKLFICIEVCILGGMSSFFQVNSVILKSHLKMKDYVLSKLLSATILLIIFAIIIAVKYSL
jgi:sporulation integral membrane protein YlbJ